MLCGPLRTRSKPSSASRAACCSAQAASRSLPPDTVCAGSPAKVICTLDEYLERHRRRMREKPTFEYMEYDIRFIDEARRRRMLDALATTDGYMVGGRSAELRGEGGTSRSDDE